MLTLESRFLSGNVRKCSVYLNIAYLLNETRCWYQFLVYLFKGVSVAQRSVMLAYLLLMCLHNIDVVYFGVNSIILYKLKIL